MHYKYGFPSPVAMGWNGVANATPRHKDVNPLPPLGIFLQFFVEERLPEILVELNLGLCGILES